MRYFLNIKFNGANYHGWQIQPNAISVQEKLENAIACLLRKSVPVVGCGRTDTGVHASDFYLHFDTNSLNGLTNTDFIYKLNGILPNDIKICNMFAPEDQELHARFSAIKRTYRYTIISEKDPFIDNLSYRFSTKLDIDLMNRACNILSDYTDFSCFSKTDTQVATNNCKISYAQWEKHDHIITFTISADRFLRNMVRAICGTMLDIGTHKIDIDDFRKIIEGKERSSAGASVPAHGLCLVKVAYPENAVPKD